MRREVGSQHKGFCAPGLYPASGRGVLVWGSSLGCLSISVLMLVCTIMGWLELEETLKPI